MASLFSHSLLAGEARKHIMTQMTAAEIEKANDRKEASKPYYIRMHCFQGRSGSGGYTYELTFNKSMVHTGRHKDIENGLNYPRARTWLGRVWNALRNR